MQALPNSVNEATVDALFTQQSYCVQLILSMHIFLQKYFIKRIKRSGR